KTIGFHIRAHGLEIRAPRNVKQRQLERAIESKKNWLKNNLHALEKRQQRWLDPAEVWCEHGVFPFMGKPVEIAFKNLPYSRAQSRKEHPQRLFIPPPSNTAEADKHCTHWRQDQARQRLSHRSNGR